MTPTPHPTKTLAAAGLALLLSLPPAAGADTRQVDITFLLTGSTYNMEGLARAAAVARFERAAREYVLYLHAGNMISPSLMSAVDMGRHTVELLNLEAPDAFVPGNHEFDFGPEVFAEVVVGGLRSALLAANLRERGHGGAPDGIADSKIYDFGGVQVGVMGLLSAGVPAISNPGDGLVFGDPIAAARATAAALRDAGADLVVALAHTRFDDDETLFRSGVIDLLLSGHDQELVLKYDGQTVWAEPPVDASSLVAVDLSVTVDDAGGVRWTPAFRVIDSADFAPAADAAALMAHYRAQLDATLGDPIGVTATALDTRQSSVRRRETAFGNLLTDVMRATVQADAAFTNAGGIRANRRYDAGTTLSAADIIEELPFGNTVIKLQLSGATLRSVLEHGVSRINTDAGHFLQVSGIRMEVDPTAPAGNRLRNITINRKPLSRNATYHIATNDFIKAGGDGFTMLRNTKPLPGSGQLLANALIEHIKQHSPISPRVEGRIRIGR